MVDNCGRDVRAGELGGLFVARIYAVPDEDNPSGYGDEQLANAHLIAAAPEMYEALKTISRRGYGGLDAVALGELITIAQTAIRKAEGRS